MRHRQRIWFVGAVSVAWLTVGFGVSKLVAPEDATTTESIVPHSVGWLLLMPVVSIASFMPEWRCAGRTWQKIVFWLGPTVVMLDVLLHWVFFDLAHRTYEQVSGPERLLLTLTYFVIGPLILVTLVALLTQLGKRRSVPEP